MSSRRGWIVVALWAAVILVIGTCGKARALATEPLSVPCDVVRSQIRWAGGLENAIRLALSYGVRQHEIQRIIRRCGLRD